MDRQQALNLVKEKIKTDNLIKHSLAVETIMRQAAEYLKENKEKYALVGLLHDLDFEETKNNPEKHALLTIEMLKGKIESDMLEAIKEHNFENLKIEPKTKIGKILIAADAVSGLIIAAALIRGKKLQNVSLESLKNSFGKKDFAKGCDRNLIKRIEEFMPLEKFLDIALNALKSIDFEIGL